MPFLLPLVLGTALAGTPAPLGMRVERGHAELSLDGAESRSVGVRDGVVPLTLPVVLEVPVASEVELFLPGAWSVRLSGPLTVAWVRPAPEEPPEGEGAAAGDDPPPEGEAPPLPEPVLVLALADLARAEVELRARALELRVPGHAWNLEAGRGAFRLEALAGGRLRVHHHGGAPIRVRDLALRPPGTWPAWIRPGERAVLPPAPPPEPGRGR